MRDEDVAVAQERRREGGERPLAHQGRHRLDAAPGPMAARDIDIIGARLLERQADEFAAALDAGPVEEFVGHRLSPSIALPRPAHSPA